MRLALALFVLIFLIAPSARAQLLSETPLCVKLINATGNEALGHVETAEYYDADGNLSWHRSAFRIAKDAEQDVCSTGPFFDGYRLRVVVKTLIPLYSCLTEMNKTITISYQMPPSGIRELVMDCPSEKAE